MTEHSEQSGPVSYLLDGDVAVITLDDGKVNALSPVMLAGLGRALDAAEAADATVLLSGRPGFWSAGFDLRILGAGGNAAIDLVRSGFEMSLRLLSFPRPVVIACTGHAIAMGAFLLLSADYRIGAAGAYRFQANEVAIGVPMPYTAIEVMRLRLTPAAFQSAISIADTFTTASAVAAGFLDAVTDEPLAAAALERARALAALPQPAHHVSKMRARAAALEAIRRAMEADAG